jgi:hypothetical protein
VKLELALNNCESFFLWSPWNVCEFDDGNLVSLRFQREKRENCVVSSVSVR